MENIAEIIGELCCIKCRFQKMNSAYEEVFWTTIIQSARSVKMEIGN